MTETTGNFYRQAINMGLLAGVVALSVSAIGMVELFGKRDLVANVLTMGQVLIFSPLILFVYVASRAFAEKERGRMLINAVIIGFVSALPLIALIILAQATDLRRFLINVTPALIDLLSFGQSGVVGSLIMLIASMVLGLASAGLHLLPHKYLRPLLSGILYTLTIGMFSEILSDRVRSFFGPGAAKVVFTAKALNPIVAGLLFILIAGITAWWGRNQASYKERIANLSSARQKRLRWGTIGLGVVLLLLLPLLLGTYLSEVINNVGIFVLMGLGLNIVVGFAGLLDLGYVAFFAIGAYTMGVLTSEGALGIAGIPFWAALPICVLAAVLAGIILGVPVLRMRGDYLAIVTLGFGEIIRILALSDLLKPLIGGAQGVLQIPKPEFLGISLVKPGQIYYIILAGVLLAAFVSWRLRDARLGRQWMAMREDEDVSEAMGINLVNTKLLAFAIGAGFSGLSGAIFASKLTSIFPHSFNILISINVLCLIIVGGMGSLPGVVVGALILVGLPELLREFAEFRMLMYGALLIVMMLAKPEGFWPSAVQRRELHAHEEQALASSNPLVESE